MFKLEGVIVSVGYGDFLEHTLPENMQYFDRLVVVTSYADKRTQALCSKLSVECVQTDCMYDHGEKMNKGRAINLGLGHLHQDHWVMQLDADIVLPPNFRGLLKHARLKKENLYGADRVNVRGYDHWMKFKHKIFPSHQSRYFIQPPEEFPLAARIIHHEHGFVNIGFLQLWFGPRRYPITQGNAEHTDVLFACQWPRYQRILLPEVICYHLETGNGHMGSNWNGRQTPEFGPHHPKPHHPVHHPVHHPAHHEHHPHHGYKPCLEEKK